MTQEHASDAKANDREDDAPDESARASERGPGDHEWRRIFQVELAAYPEDRRVEMARLEEGDRLRALCHDPSSRVAQAVLENESFGLEHARLLARHHHTGPGLDALARRPEFQRDLQVQRNLFRNSQVTPTILRRIFGRYRVSQIYRLTTSHDVSSKVRNLAKKAFRKKFTESSAEEKVRLILKTEGRCLGSLAGVALGGKAAALLVRRPLHSTLLVRNLARWPSTPPPVLQHMARQPMVRRSPQLMGKILQHPNAPSRLKRELG